MVEGKESPERKTDWRREVFLFGLDKVTMAVIVIIENKVTPPKSYAINQLKFAEKRGIIFL